MPRIVCNRCGNVCSGDAFSCAQCGAVPWEPPKGATREQRAEWRRLERRRARTALPETVRNVRMRHVHMI